MVIDLNRKHITKGELLKHIQDIDIYRFYIGKEIDMSHKILSPLRDEEDPSFGFFVGESGEICYNDFVLGSGDCIKFVQKFFSLNFFEAMSKIALDFGIADKFIVKRIEQTSSNYKPSTKVMTRENLIKEKGQMNLGKRGRRWMAYDYAFWLQFGIDSETLLKYRVQPIDYIFINESPIKADKYAYAFTEHKGRQETYKIYQPYSEKYKWLNNHDSSIWQGWSQLPTIGKELIITKSLKDVMAIYSTTGIPSVSLQSETTTPKLHIIQELRGRFKRIWILYDNDYDKETNWGREYAENLADLLNIPNIEIPSLYKSKDYSDLIKHKDTETAILLLDVLMHQHDKDFTGAPF